MKFFQRLYKMSLQRRLTLVNAGSYGDIFGVC